MHKPRHRHKLFDDAASAALNKITKDCATTMPDRQKFVPIETYLTKWVNTMNTTSRDWKTDLSLAAMVLGRAGVEALHWFKDTGDAFNTDEMLKLVLRKQRDYGHKNILNFGLVGIAIRVCDKIARIDNLSGTNTQPQYESLVDSYHDIVGYAVLAIMVEEGSFELPLKRN